MKPTLLILAAGMGSRYGGLKQMDPIGPSGEAIMDYSIYDAKRAGFGKIVFVIRPDIESDFKEMFLDKLNGHIDVDYVFQEKDMLPEGFELPEGRQKPWGTAHAMLVAEEKIDTPFAVINADDYYGVESYKVMADFLTSGKEDDIYSMVGFQLDKTLSEHGCVSRGICEKGEDGYLSEVIERTDICLKEKEIYYNEGDEKFSLKGNEIVSMNFWGFYPNVFGHLNRYFIEFLDEKGDQPKSEFFIPLAATNLIDEGFAKFEVLESKASWFGVTYPQDRPFVVEAIQNKVKEGIYPEKLW